MHVQVYINGSIHAEVLLNLTLMIKNIFSEKSFYLCKMLYINATRHLKCYKFTPLVDYLWYLDSQSRIQFEFFISHKSREAAHCCEKESLIAV